MEQATSSAGASATSAAPQRIYHGEQGDVTEVWSFGRWLEPQDKMIASNANEFAQQPLTEHRITLEITENFPSGHPTSSEHVDRQLLSRTFILIIIITKQRNYSQGFINIIKVG